MNDDFIVAMTTIDNKDAADRLAATLVERRLAGCAQIVGPITSAYRWEGELEMSQEWLCLIKSRAGLFDALREAIEELHAYDVPEIMALPIVAVSEAYAAWLTAALGATREKMD